MLFIQVSKVVSDVSRETFSCSTSIVLSIIKFLAYMRKLDINNMIIVRSSGAMVAHGNLVESLHLI